MRCKQMAQGPKGSFPCGQCVPCRINSLRDWQTRLMLEAETAPSLFVTLTYAPEHVVATPEGELTLVPEHATKFLKRLRKRLEPRRIRYFLVGEYGADPLLIPRDKWPPWMTEDHKPRPHYHLIIYGLSISECVVVKAQRGREHIQHPAVHEAWGMGHTECDEFSPGTAAYVCGYVLKKLTRETEWTAKILRGRQPEFIRTSRKPGLGCGPDGSMVDELARCLARDDPSGQDVPSSIMLGPRHMPYPKHVAAKVREARGFERLARDRPPRPLDPLDFEPSGVLTSWRDARSADLESREMTRAEQLSVERAERLERKLAAGRRRAKL